jgi:predicted GNAT superfamily acetyltransferase
VYGRTSSPLHHGLPTDRLVAQWRIRDPRVEQMLSNQGLKRLAAEEQVCIPRNILEICDQDAEKAKELQSQVRGQFQPLFADGFGVTGFELDKQSGKYLLQRI